MISKQEFKDVVAQINARFDWFTAKVSDLEKEVEDLKNPTKSSRKTTKTTKTEETDNG